LKVARKDKKYFRESSRDRNFSSQLSAAFLLMSYFEGPPKLCSKNGLASNSADNLEQICSNKKVRKLF